MNGNRPISYMLEIHNILVQKILILSLFVLASLISVNDVWGFEFSEDETVVGTSQPDWNIGKINWLENDYSSNSIGIVRVIDSDMNFNPDALDNFRISVWSDSDVRGINLTVTETGKKTGIFEGTVSFTTHSESSGHMLKISSGDTVTAEYEDNTLPYPYTTNDEFDVVAMTIIPNDVTDSPKFSFTNPRVLDSSGNESIFLSGNPNHVTADVTYSGNTSKDFTYLVQIENSEKTVQSINWISNHITFSQLLSPTLSWIPEKSDTYIAHLYIFDSIQNLKLEYASYIVCTS